MAPAMKPRPSPQPSVSQLAGSKRRAEAGDMEERMPKRSKATHQSDKLFGDEDDEGEAVVEEEEEEEEEEEGNGGGDAQFGALLQAEFDLVMQVDFAPVPGLEEEKEPAVVDEDDALGAGLQAEFDLDPLVESAPTPRRATPSEFEIHFAEEYDEQVALEEAEEDDDDDDAALDAATLAVSTNAPVVGSAPVASPGLPISPPLSSSAVPEVSQASSRETAASLVSGESEATDTETVSVAEETPEPKGRKRRAQAPKPTASFLVPSATREALAKSLGPKRGGNVYERFMATSRAGRDKEHAIPIDDDDTASRAGGDKEHVVTIDDAPTTPPRAPAVSGLQLLTPPPGSAVAETRKERRARLKREHQEAKDKREADMVARYSVTAGALRSRQEIEADSAHIEAARVAAGCAPEERWPTEEEKKEKKKLKMQQWRASQAERN